MLDVPSANPDGVLSLGDVGAEHASVSIDVACCSVQIPLSPHHHRGSLVFWQQAAVLFPFFKLSSAFTLSLPDRFDSRTLVTVQWTRDSGDAFSFGLMQRSLQGNQSVLSVTPVENSNAGSSGTTQVAFNTAGQVLLSVISQLSLSSGEIPEQLSAGKQLTVVPSDNGAVEIPGTTGVSPFSLTQMSTTSPATAQASPAEFAQRPGMQRSAVIALAVILPLLFLSAVAFCIYMDMDAGAKSHDFVLRKRY
ncbi:hypothetical protein FB451DRAFT_1559252 [Mycena latifolia]|nr:hypothetical protein FB451DRAFT_1559252 [Mycena latifolia]